MAAQSLDSRSRTLGLRQSGFPAATCRCSGSTGLISAYARNKWNGAATGSGFASNGLSLATARTTRAAINRTGFEQQSRCPGSAAHRSRGRGKMQSDSDSRGFRFEASRRRQCFGLAVRRHRGEKCRSIATEFNFKRIPRDATHRDRCLFATPTGRISTHSRPSTRFSPKHRASTAVLSSGARSIVKSRERMGRRKILECSSGIRRGEQRPVTKGRTGVRHEPNRGRLRNLCCAQGRAKGRAIRTRVIIETRCGRNLS